MPLWIFHVRCKGIPYLIYTGAKKMGNCPQAGEKPLPPASEETHPAQEHTLPQKTGRQTPSHLKAQRSLFPRAHGPALAPPPFLELLSLLRPALSLCPAPVSVLGETEGVCSYGQPSLGVGSGAGMRSEVTTVFALGV